MPLSWCTHVSRVYLRCTYRPQPESCYLEHGRLSRAARGDRERTG